METLPDRPAMADGLNPIRPTRSSSKTPDGAPFIRIGRQRIPARPSGALKYAR